MNAKPSQAGTDTPRPNASGQAKSGTSKPKRANASPRITDADVTGLKYFRHLRSLLHRLHDHGCERDRAGNRTLHMDQYVMLVLLYLLNPTLSSLRGIQQASDLRRVQKKLGCARASLGSLSEAATVFDPSLLQGIIEELHDQLQPLEKAPRNKDPRLKDLKHTLTLVDGSLLKGLPHLMAQALGDQPARKSGYKWRLHTQFNLGKGVPKAMELRPNLGGEHGERNVLEAALEPGQTYVLDRGYSKFGLFNAIAEVGSSYVCRLPDDSVYRVQQETPLSPEAAEAGVLQDALVSLGSSARRQSAALTHQVRVLRIKVPQNPKRPHAGSERGHGSDGVLRLATNLLEVPAELIGLIYRYRWTIEIFFRFFKHVLGCRHLLSQNAEGIRLQCYGAIIACMLIALWTGRQPTLRSYEMVCHYFSGLAELDELMAHLEKLKKQGEDSIAP